MKNYTIKERIKDIVLLRLKALYFFFAGTLSFSQMLSVFPPHFLKSGSGVGTFFGKPIIDRSNMSDFVGLLWQIVVKNQYHIELIKDGSIIIDAGANMGVFSIFAAVKHPDATIFAFEPTPSIFEALQENVKYYPNIKAFNCGLGDEEKIATIIEVSSGGGGNYIGEGGIPVGMKTIDSLSTRVDFLKMDVEGYEAKILNGAAETIKKYKPVIAMSAYHHPEDKTELPKLLNSIAPYNCELRHDCEEVFTCKPK